MSNKLPTKLDKEPLVDAVFEVRFSMQSPASNILPGIFFTKLTDVEKNIEQLSASQIPKHIRDADPNIKFAPLIRINWKEFFLLIGDMNVAIGCKLPYPGWAEFKKTITQVITTILEANVINNIQRFSLKYVNLIPSTNIEEQVASVRLNLTLGSHTLKKEVFQLRMEQTDKELIHIIQIISSAFVTTPNAVSKEGLVIDIDTVRNVNNQNPESFLVDFEQNIDCLHHENKRIFFDYITRKTLTDLNPHYE